MARYTHGAPPPIPDFGSTPVQRQGGFLPATVPNASGGSAATPPPPQVQVFPWWLYPWEAASQFSIRSLNASIAGPGVVAMPTFTFTVPQQQRGVVKSISMTVQSSTAAMNLQLTLLKNSAPIQGWSGIPFPPILATGENIVFNGINIFLQQNEILTAQFAEIGGNTWTVSLTASGWTIAEAEIARMQQGVRY